MSSQIDAVFDKVTGHGRQISADGLYALRRQVIQEAHQQKLTSLPDHAREVLQRAVDLFNRTSGATVPVTLVDATDEYPGLGISEITVRLEQGELGAAQEGHPEPALTFHRFVKRQGLLDVFRTPSAPRRLPFVAAGDKNERGETVLEILNQLDLGHDGDFGSVLELQQFLNQNKADGLAAISEDGDAGPMTLDAIRSRLIAQINAAALPTQLLSLINSAQVLFQDMKATSVEAARRTINGEAAPALYTNPLYDGELRDLLQRQAASVTSG